MPATAMRSLLVLAMLIPSTGSALADEIYGFVQITCAPDIGYFAVRRFQIYNLPHMGPFLTEGLDAGKSEILALQSKYGIYTSEGLSEKPFECSIPPVKPVPGWDPKGLPGFSARVVGNIDSKSDGSSYRNMVDNAEVFLNGRSLARLGLNPYGLTVGTSSIEITQGQPDLVKTECALPDWQTDDNKLACKESSIPPQAQQNGK